MKQADRVIHAKWLITCEENNRTLENHALVIHGAHIIDILPSSQANQQYTSTAVENYLDHAVMPGFVNSHTHLAMNFFRGLADDLALLDWLNHHIWPAEKKFLSDEFVYDASLFAMAEMIRSGTTCFNDMFFFMPATARATEVAGLRGNIAIHIITFPTTWASGAEEEFTKGLAFYDAFKNSAHVNITLAAHSLYTITDDQVLLRVRSLAEELNLQINMHVQEPKNEIDIVYKQSQVRPLQRLNQLGLLNQRLMAVHMLHANAEDIRLLAQSKAHVIHCPESNMKLASGTCAVTELLAHGVNVALGTDGAASNNDLDMLGEMRTAAFLAKHSTGEPTSLPAAQVLQMATLNGAKALAIDRHTGSLTIGKAADFIAINLDEIETLPCYHPTSQIVYAASRHQVTDVWVAGKQLLKNRKLLTLDESELKNKANYWRKKIAQNAS